MTFDQWWLDIGQRTQSFNAYEFAKAGWNGCKIHGCHGLANPEPTLDEQNLLEDKKE